MYPVLKVLLQIFIIICVYKIRKLTNFLVSKISEY